MAAIPAQSDPTLCPDDVELCRDMKLQYLCLVLVVLVSQICVSEAYPFRTFRPGNMDYMEALRRMQQIPQWHCMRYRRFQLHGPCSRWWLMRRT